MQIIIVGCGKVGYTLVEQLNGENHDIVVIDTNEEHVRSVTDELDAMGVVGNGASFQTLLEAGIKKEHLAVTNVCTCCNSEVLFSHRASQGKRGNLAAFLALI